ncbi:hypothetical protein LIER_34321 [Lithospermum erythrorhizon]|uniref:Uncharacterized protein n=1 Tax=Lithospermum erythrorhizon TaxID=34254 RepID=A0AAV3RZ64_LITER
MADPTYEENPTEKQRSRPLHNFTLPKWGHQKHLRCKKPSSSSASEGGGIRDEKKVDNKIGTLDEIDEMSHKLVHDLKVDGDKMPHCFLDESEKQRKHEVVEEEMNATRPWNLRSKRGGGSGASSTFSPFGFGGGLRGMEEEEMFGGGGGGGSSSFQPPMRPKFRRTLTKEEIEADFIAMTGAKPPRKSQRRPKPIQRQLDNLVPGSRLREAKPEMYEADNANPGKPGKVPIDLDITSSISKNIVVQFIYSLFNSDTKWLGVG